ncbi:MAG: pentapeptide repeat-containing protein [Candidatus Arsenophonus phytopathogenicus]
MIEVNLTEVKMIKANLSHANLTNTNLINVDLSNIDSHSAILEELNINNTNFAGASLNNTLTLALPNNWSARNLEAKLNHFNYQGSLLTSIASIDDKYNELKINIVNGITIDSLYEKYLNLPKIQQLVKQEEIKGVFGDYEGNADWADKHAANYLLLSPTKPGRTLIVSENILNNMLHPDRYTKWDNIVLFQDGKCLSPAEYNLTQCYQQEFPLFSIPFKDGHYQASLHKLIETLDLGERFKPLFLDALNSKSHSTKLVDDIVQQELNKIFSRVIDAKEYQLKEQNYDQIINLFHLTSSTNREKAEHLFSLATVFSRYTSKVFFGTEDNSPIILRYYAYALMEKAHQIDPTSLSDRFDEWKKTITRNRSSKQFHLYQYII